MDDAEHRSVRVGNEPLVAALRQSPRTKLLRLAIDRFKSDRKAIGWLIEPNSEIEKMAPLEIKEKRQKWLVKQIKRREGRLDP